MINVNKFLESSDFEILEEVNIPKFDLSNLETLNDIGLNNLEFTQIEGLNGLSEASAISDKSDTPSTPSYQPLNEAGFLTSGEAINKSTIGSITNNSLGIQEDNIEFANNLSKFAEGVDFNPTEATITKIKETQEILSKGTLSIANGAELANSGIKFAGANLQFGGSNISFGSDTVMHTTAPIINTVSSVETRQAKTIQETSDLKTSVTKDAFTQVEGLNSTISQNSIRTTTQADVSVSNYHSNTALEKSINKSNDIENIAGNLIKNRSEGIITNEAETAITTQSSTINITASEGSSSSTGTPEVGEDQLGITENNDGSYNVGATDGSGKSIKLKNVKDNNVEKWRKTKGLQGITKNLANPVKGGGGNGNLNILAKGSGGTVSIINENFVASSKGSYNNSVGGNINNVAKGSVTNSGRFVNMESDVGTTVAGKGYVRTQSGKSGTVISNGFTFAGFRFASAKNFIDKAKNVPLEIREVPALSEIPLSIGAQDLENCIPDKYKKKDNGEPEIEEELDLPDEVAAPILEEARRREKSQPIPSGKDVAGVSKDGGLLGNINNTNSNKIDGNTILGSDASPNDQLNVSNRNKLTSASAVFKGGADIYPLDGTEAFDLFKRQGPNIIDPDAGEESGGDELLLELIESISPLSITNASIKLNQKPEIGQLVKEDVRALKNYLFTELQVDITLLTKFQKITPEQGRVIDNLLKIQEAKELIDTIEEELKVRASIGGVLGFVSSVYNKVEASVNIASDFIDDNSKKNVFQVLRTGSDIAKVVTNDQALVDIDKIINSSESLSNIYGQVKSIVGSEEVTVGSVVDKINFQDVETVISQGLSTVGVNNVENATAIAKILKNVKNSQIYQDEGLSKEVVIEIIIQISDLTGLTRGQARQLYEDSEEVIANLLSGNVENLIEGSELQNIVGFFIGSSNAAILGDIRNIYFQAKNAIDLGKDLYSEGEQLYQSADELYSSLKSIPAIVGMMNEYEIPLLNQVKVVLQCFELLDQVERILNNTKATVSKFNQLRGSVEGLYSAFSDLIGINDAPGSLTNITPYQSVSEGFAEGNVLANSNFNSNNNSNNNNTNNLLNIATNAKDFEDYELATGNHSEISGFNENPLLNPDAGLIDGNTPLNSESCSLTVYSYSADTQDSNNPADWINSNSKTSVIDYIEKLPRLVQIYNSVTETPEDLPVVLFNELSKEQIEDIKTTKPVVNPDSCFIAPKLNLIESLINVIEISDGKMLYEMKHPESLSFNNKQIFPTTNTLVQIYVEEFFNNKLGVSMYVERSQEFFSPKVYSFKTIVYDKQKNLGLASIINTQSRIHLKNTNGITYNYSIAEIGNKLDPSILDAYIVA